MVLPTDLCPWLGTDLDREIRHAEPAETHVCYARKRQAGIELDYQSEFCLRGEHRSCRFYREPPAPAASPPPVIPEVFEDEVGPRPDRFPVLRVLLWGAAIVAVLAAIYYFGSSLLTPLSTATPVASSDVTAVARALR